MRAKDIAIVGLVGLVVFLVVTLMRRAQPPAVKRDPWVAAIDGAALVLSSWGKTSNVDSDRDAEDFGDEIAGML